MRVEWEGLGHSSPWTFPLAYFSGYLNVEKRTNIISNSNRDPKLAMFYVISCDSQKKIPRGKSRGGDRWNCPKPGVRLPKLFRQTVPQS